MKPNDDFINFDLRIGFKAMHEYHKILEASQVSILAKVYNFPESINKHLTLICMFMGGTNGS
jgi:hypothetical protein